MSRAVDVAAVLSGSATAPTPTVGGRRTDGLRMLYPGTVNGLVGDPEAGKTLVAAAFVADELAAGGSAYWIDLDWNGAYSTAARLLRFGVALEVLIDTSRFRLAIGEDEADVREIVEEVVSWRPTLTVLDSVGELVAMFGRSSNSADEYRAVNSLVMARCARAGTAVLVVDHHAKNGESRAFGAGGTVAKKSAIDGAYLGVKRVRTFVPGRGGVAEVRVLKDRHGALRAATSSDTTEPLVARFELREDGDGCEYRFAAPSEAVPEASSEKVERLVERLEALTVPPTTGTEAATILGGRKTDALAAFRAYVARRDGAGSGNRAEPAGNREPVQGREAVPEFPPLKGGTGNRRPGTQPHDDEQREATS